MVGTYEHDDSPTKTIRRLVKEISENLSVKTNNLRRQAARMREDHVLHERRACEEVVRLSRMLEELKASNQTLINRRQAIQDIIRKDEEELARIEGENESLQVQLKELQHLNKKFGDARGESEDKYGGLQARYQSLKSKYDAKMREQKLVNHNFKTYLGIDIFRIKDRALKIVFHNLGAECYVIIDFSMGDCVSECVPDLNLERLNFMFREGGDFYRFIRFVRAEIRKRL